jgi:hypothetical protein
VSDEFVWMRYPATGGVQAFPVDAVPNWKARGWVETDEPVVLPIWKDPAPEPEADVETAQEELARVEAELLAAQERLAAAKKAAEPVEAEPAKPVSNAPQGQNEAGENPDTDLVKTPDTSRVPADKPAKKTTSARVTEADGKENGLG